MTVIHRLAAIAFADAGELVDGEGRMIHLADLPPNLRIALKAVDVDAEGRIRRVEFHEKGAALARLMEVVERRRRRS